MSDRSHWGVAFRLRIPRSSSSRYHQVVELAENLAGYWVAPNVVEVGLILHRLDVIEAASELLGMCYRWKHVELHIEGRPVSPYIAHWRLRGFLENPALTAASQLPLHELWVEEPAAPASANAPADRPLTEGSSEDEPQAG